MSEQSAATQNQQQLTAAEGESLTDPKDTVPSITNICYDCLERIFDNLDLRSLMNVAATCKRLKIAAAAKFNDDHGGKLILLESYALDDRIFVESKEICVMGSKLLHSFLWSFGAKISHLNIDALQDCTSLVQDINKYCADTLKSLQCYNMQGFFSVENSPKPFALVDEVCFVGCDLNKDFDRINIMFPNLRYLDLEWNILHGNFSGAVSIPHLKRLDTAFGTLSGFSLKAATDMIKANLHLQELRLVSDERLELAKLFDMISENTSILNLTVPNIYGQNTDDVMRFAVEHPLIIDLDLKRLKMTANDAIAFIRKMNSMRKFRFGLTDGFQYDVLKRELDEEWKIERVNDFFGTTCILQR